MAKVQFGWSVSAVGNKATEYVPLPIYQQDAIIPAAAEYFDSLWVQDHLYAFDDANDPFLECLTTLTWLAARFPTLRVGPIVLAVGFRHPALLAKMTATLQALSGGRFIMGIGAGWREPEYGAYGYPFPKASVRIRQLDEAVRILRLMWTAPAPTFKGTHFQIENAYCAPRPTPLPPIMIGGGGDKVLAIAAREADLWDIYHGGQFDTVDQANYRQRRDVLHRHAEAQNRDPATIQQSLTIGEAKLPTTEAESRRWLDALPSLLDLGITQFILDCGHVTSTDPVRRFGEEVIAPLNEGRT